MFTVYGETWNLRGSVTGEFSFDTSNEAEALSLYEGLCNEPNVKTVGIDDDGLNWIEALNPFYGF